MKLLYIVCLAFVLVLTMHASTFAQEKIAIEQDDYSNRQIEMADRFRADGKIWVVMAVAGLIFIGFIGYTVSIDRRLAKLEKELPERNQVA